MSLQRVKNFGASMERVPATAVPADGSTPTVYRHRRAAAASGETRPAPTRVTPPH
jgi:hypothetical protein